MAEDTMPRRDFLRLMLGGGAGAVVGFPQNKGAEDGNKPRQETPNIPSDILSDEELWNQYHTVIHDLPETDFPNNFVELQLRRSIKDVPLFKRLQEQRLGQLDIFLIDGDSIDPAKFTDEQRDFMNNYPTIVATIERQRDELKEFNRKEIEDRREDMRVEYQQKLSEVRSQNFSENRLSVEEMALEYTYGRYIREEPNDEDLREFAMRGYAPMLGTESPPHSFIFIAVRDREKTVTFQSGEEVKTISSNRVPYRQEEMSLAPNPNQSYPNESNFTLAENPDELGYVVVGGHTPGFILRHEAEHAGGLFDEESADRQALAGIVEASEHMAETGSDEKYWAVFRTPEGVVVTENPNSVTGVV